MQDLARLQARIASLAQLSELFSALRAMSASRVQAAQSALAGIRQYTSTIERALGLAASLTEKGGAPSPRNPAHAVLIAIGSENGFVGSFNRLLLEKVATEKMPGEKVAIVGRRLSTLTEEHAIQPAWIEPMATNVPGVLPCAGRVAARLGDCEEVRIAYCPYRLARKPEIEVRRVLPPAPSLLIPPERAQPPLHHLEPDLLLRRLFGDFLLAELALTMMETFASESAARLQIMHAADHNISDKLDHLNREARQLRQEQITSEVFEVLTGSMAVGGAPDR